MSVFSGPALKKKVYPLMPTGEYVATLSDLTYEQGGAYGDSLLWKWLLALPSSPTDCIVRDDGEEKILHEYTPLDVILGSKSHEWIASLTGHTLRDGEQPPEADDLLGKRMLVYVAHLAPKQGPNAGILREKFSQGTSKKWDGPSKTVATVQAPPAPTDEESTRSALVAKVEKLVGKSVKLGTPSHTDYVALNLDTASVDDLQLVAAAIQDEIEKALED